MKHEVINTEAFQLGFECWNAFVENNMEIDLPNPFKPFSDNWFAFNAGFSSNVSGL